MMMATDSSVKIGVSIIRQGSEVREGRYAKRAGSSEVRV
jgi:hypothetical protein